MKYLIRAVKYFFYFAILTTVIVTALVMIGAVEGGIENIFEDGYNSLYKIAIFFAIVAAVYPKFGFVTSRLEYSQNCRKNLFPGKTVQGGKRRSRQHHIPTQRPYRQTDQDVRGPHNNQQYRKRIRHGRFEKGCIPLCYRH